MDFIIFQQEKLKFDAFYQFFGLTEDATCCFKSEILSKINKNKIFNLKITNDHHPTTNPNGPCRERSFRQVRCEQERIFGN